MTCSWFVALIVVCDAFDDSDLELDAALDLDQLEDFPELRHGPHQGVLISSRCCLHCVGSMSFVWLHVLVVTPDYDLL